jgi:2-oxoglutarate dehydrogenase complex dehydrogenase (E1) component-like enzyme
LYVVARIRTYVLEYADIFLSRSSTRSLSRPLRSFVFRVIFLPPPAILPPLLLPPSSPPLLPSPPAQCFIDQFIAAGEAKWGERSSLVLLLPHGFEGQGPEHSSSRLERFLQLVDDDPDDIPGHGVFERLEFDTSFSALDVTNDGCITTAELRTLFLRLQESGQEDDGADSSESSRMPVNDRDVDVAVAEIINEILSYNRSDEAWPSTSHCPANRSDEGSPSEDLNLGLKVRLSSGSVSLRQSDWTGFLQAWLQRNSEARHNLCVVNPSTPAQYFHVLRRQIHRPYAKPVVIMSPKYLYHHGHCRSHMSAFDEGTFFHRLIAEGGDGDNMRGRTQASLGGLLPPPEIRRVIFCSGKVFYDLYHRRAALKMRDVMLVRVEQIAPFPYDRIKPVIQMHRHAEFVWVQEEPKNAGGYAYVEPRFRTAIRAAFDAESSDGGGGVSGVGGGGGVGGDESGGAGGQEQRRAVRFQPGSTTRKAPTLFETNRWGDARRMKRLRYVGRPPSASPATGSYRIHVAEMKRFVEEALEK